MRFQCLEHGEIDELLLNGQRVGAYSNIDADESDLHEIVFYVTSPEGGELGASHIRVADDVSEYLDTFGDWREAVLEIVRYHYEERASSGDFDCPCGKRPQREGQDSCIVTVTDELFAPDVPVRGEFGVYDGKLVVGEIFEYKCSEEELVSGLVNQARADGLDVIKFKQWGAGKVGDVIGEMGFGVVIESHANRSDPETESDIAAELVL